MRTYLPYSDFAKCAACFTLKRLIKQRHDVMELLYMLDGQPHPQRGDRFMYNSPPKKVWQYCPLALVRYGEALCAEYEKRKGRLDPIRERLSERRERIQRRGVDRGEPQFLSCEAMHKSHRAILARQDAEHYSKFGFERDPDDEKVFYWPVDEANAQYESVAAVSEPLDGEFDDDNRDDSDDSDFFDDSCDCPSCRLERSARD